MKNKIKTTIIKSNQPLSWTNIGPKRKPHKATHINGQWALAPTGVRHLQHIWIYTVYVIGTILYRKYRPERVAGESEGAKRMPAPVWRL